MRVTKQKQLILDIINESHSHLTAEGVYNECQKTLPNISLGTVYRNLNQLVDMKLVRRIKALDNLDHFDNLKVKHNHFFCTNCYSIVDIFTDFSIRFDNIIGNQVDDYEINFTGVCKKCLEKGEIKYGTQRK